MKNQIVSNQEWTAARKKLLEKEKEFTRLREELTKERQQLPWEKVKENYTFDTLNGKETLSDLFNGKSQLIVYHFMFGPDWEEGCKSCSLCADHYDASIANLNQRDVSMITVSRAPLAILQDFKKRMGWNFKWVSSQENNFNQDYNVSFSPEQIENKEVYYNYNFENSFQMPELPGISVFYKDEAGELFHTYSAYARGLEDFLGIYRLLDIVPKGRDESKLPYGMAWVQIKDNYNK